MENHITSLPIYCANICVIECCGLDACDLSAIHMASYCMSRNYRFPLRVLKDIIDQAETLKANFGSNGASDKGITLSDINERMSGARVDKFADLIVLQASAARSILLSSEANDRDPILVWGKA